MDEFIGYVNSTFGRMDVIVNNAGVMPLSPLEALKVEEWSRMIDVNIRSVLHGIAAGLSVMKQQGFSHFITIASIGAYRVTPTAAVLLRHEIHRRPSRKDSASRWAVISA